LVRAEDVALEAGADGAGSEGFEAADDWSCWAVPAAEVAGWSELLLLHANEKLNRSKQRNRVLERISLSLEKRFEHPAMELDSGGKCN
jgi:hypothetical protein